MAEPAIIVENLSKQYRIGANRGRQNFREALVDAIAAPFRRLRSFGQSSHRDSDSIWALRDVSFEVQPGEVVGIIGRNGAGKSTLLKILSRITAPTEGRAIINGRVASLLEVGTGFHPELTGRENIYLSGAILGMSRQEINAKFDEIVEFSGVGKFIDTPVKRYSSGMHVRLGFAVAAHLEPDILVIDEVLAVGDSEFQRRCLGKMEQVSHSEGRTVLFVSHNMPAVRSLCGSCFLIDGGRLALQADSETCVERYLSLGLGAVPEATARFSRPKGTTQWMTSATLLCDGQPSTALPMGGTLSLRVTFEAEHPIRHPRLGFIISNAQGDRIINVNNRYQHSRDPEAPISSGAIVCDMGVVPLMAGRYFVSLWFGDHMGDSHVVEGALSFDVHDRDIWGTGRTPFYALMWWPTQFRLEALGDRPGANTALTPGLEESNR